MKPTAWGQLRETYSKEPVRQEGEGGKKWRYKQAGPGLFGNREQESDWRHERKAIQAQRGGDRGRGRGNRI